MQESLPGRLYVPLGQRSGRSAWLLVCFENERKGIGKGYRGEDGGGEIGERVGGVKEEE